MNYTPENIAAAHALVKATARAAMSVCSTLNWDAPAAREALAAAKQAREALEDLIGGDI